MFNVIEPAILSLPTQRSARLELGPSLSRNWLTLDLVLRARGGEAKWWPGRGGADTECRHNGAHRRWQDHHDRADVVLLRLHSPNGRWVVSIYAYPGGNWHTHACADVDSGNTVMDYLQQERERGITINSAAISFQWLEHRLNLIDTPGKVSQFP